MKRDKKDETRTTGVLCPPRALKLLFPAPVEASTRCWVLGDDFIKSQVRIVNAWGLRNKFGLLRSSGLHSSRGSWTNMGRRVSCLSEWRLSWGTPDRVLWVLRVLGSGRSSGGFSVRAGGLCVTSRARLVDFPTISDIDSRIPASELCLSVHIVELVPPSGTRPDSTDTPDPPGIGTHISVEAWKSPGKRTLSCSISR
jgi:hypothetical protein